ncbi:hypothetical protein [Paenibacillus sp. UNC451MF]|uniref:hypothetical protein n=1 Tax=Paenibacillus sp. UNC451MF TaxID=1449063 RepID=UPI00048CC152|nr:hypothetical protein [Paenibacillus sp. UNC451MF]
MELAKQRELLTIVFREALQTFVDKIKQDDQVIAAILMGSLSYDQVWEKSDIDLKLIVHEQKLNKSYMCFVENDVPINTSIQTRNDFKRWIERSLQSSISHSMLIRSTLLFTKDSSITPYFDQIRTVGERDRQMQLMRLGCHGLGILAKAEKWQYVKQDTTYSALWIMKLVDILAQIEVVLNGEVPMRESVQQAMTFNTDFFDLVYVQMVHNEVNEQMVHTVLQQINTYLSERGDRLFQPILAYLKEEGDVRTVTDIVDKLGVIVQIDNGSITTACDWLVEQELLVKMESETKATPKSRIELSEPAYLYENPDDLGWEM